MLNSIYRYVASTTEVWELSSLAHKLNNIDEHLNSELENCRRHIGEPLIYHFIREVIVVVKK